RGGLGPRRGDPWPAVICVGWNDRASSSDRCDHRHRPPAEWRATSGSPSRSSKRHRWRRGSRGLSLGGIPGAARVGAEPGNFMKPSASANEAATQATAWADVAITPTGLAPRLAPEQPPHGLLWVTRGTVT